MRLNDHVEGPQGTESRGEQMTTNTIATRMSNEDLMLSGGDQIDQMLALGEKLVKSGLLPDGINTPEKALVILLKGRELQLEPMYALENIHVIKGKPVLSAACMQGVAQKHGVVIETVKWNTEGCALRFTSPDGEKSEVFTFTMSDAKRAGIAGHMYQKYPREMFHSRALSLGAKRFCADIMAGCYVEGEIPDGDSSNGSDNNTDAGHQNTEAGLWDRGPGKPTATTGRVSVLTSRLSQEAQKPPATPPEPEKVSKVTEKPLKGLRLTKAVVEWVRLVMEDCSSSSDIARAPNADHLADWNSQPGTDLYEPLTIEILERWVAAVKKKDAKRVVIEGPIDTEILDPVPGASDAIEAELIPRATESDAMPDDWDKMDQFDH